MHNPKLEILGCDNCCAGVGLAQFCPELAIFLFSPVRFPESTLFSSALPIFVPISAFLLIRGHN
jgi:hypothetical protein